MRYTPEAAPFWRPKEEARAERVERRRVRRMSEARVIMDKIAHLESCLSRSAAEKTELEALRDDLRYLRSIGITAPARGKSHVGDALRVLADGSDGDGNRWVSWDPHNGQGIKVDG